MVSTSKLHSEARTSDISSRKETCPHQASNWPHRQKTIISAVTIHARFGSSESISQAGGDSSKRISTAAQKAAVKANACSNATVRERKRKRDASSAKLGN